MSVEAERDVRRACKLAYCMTPDCQTAEESVVALLKLLSEARQLAWILANPAMHGTPAAKQAAQDALLFGAPEGR